MEICGMASRGSSQTERSLHQNPGLGLGKSQKLGLGHDVCSMMSWHRRFSAFCPLLIHDYTVASQFRQSHYPLHFDGIDIVGRILAMAPNLSDDSMMEAPRQMQCSCSPIGSRGAVSQNCYCLTNGGNKTFKTLISGNIG